MKTLLMTLAIICAGNVGWAYDPSKPNSSENRYDTWASTFEWIISKGSQTYSIDEFMGRFCEWRGGHKWIEATHEDGCYYDYDHTFSDGQVRKLKSIGQKCSICHRCRQKIKVQKEELEWEK